MTVKELKDEAKKLGYNIIKKKEYIPHKRCKCGKRASIWYVVGNKYQVRCKCGRESNIYDTENSAWAEWGTMNEE